MRQPAGLKRDPSFVNGLECTLAKALLIPMVPFLVALWPTHLNHLAFISAL